MANCRRTARRVLAAFAVLVQHSVADESPTSAVRNLTLGNAYALAEERHEALPIFEAEGRAAEARYREAIGDRWPEVRAAGAALWRGTSDGDQLGDDQYRAGLGASWTIFNGFRTLRDAEARRTEGEAFRFDLERERQLLYQDVADSFYQVLSFESELASLAKQEEALRERADDLERRVELGRSRKAELLTAQSQIANVRVDAEQLRGFRDAARELMAFLTGLPPGDFELVDTMPMPLVTDVELYLAQVGERPDLTAASTRVKAAQLDVESAAAERKPEVSADANVYALSDPGEPGDWDVALRAEIPIFDKEVRVSRVAERKELVRISELNLAALHRTAGRDVRLAYRAVLSALGQWAALQDAIRVTTENHDTQQKDYELGRASNLDVLQALVQLYDLRRREAQLAMLARAAMVRLHVAAGGAVP
ncbi:MAG TPA: TolC family protein [Kiritimatiellia bacterium]|jgi:outer membrane protein